MATGKSRRPERGHTDESLRTERENADRGLADRQTAVEHDADRVVVRAREQADAVLDTARDLADQALGDTGGRGRAHDDAREVVDDARELEDKAVRDERAAADESLRVERAEYRRALLRLLPIERDKTDRHLLTERARSDDDVANRDDFLGIVSHDLRSLLGGIVMTASMLADRAAGQADGQQTVADALRVQRYAARMNRLIGDLVDVASIDAGKLAMLPAEGDVTALVAEAVDTFGAAAAAKGIALASEMVAPVRAAFDHDRLLQVLANLVTNAIKFTATGGHIRIHGQSLDHELRIAVSDTGAGIPATMLESVFERFWQAGLNDRRGIGLGLYISRCIIEAHGGTIWAESVLGEGSTFWFTLPTAAAPTP